MEKEFEAKKELQDKRKEIETFDDLVEYLKDIKDNYSFGYSEAPRAIAQASVAVAGYLSREFGITGFQASCAMWDFIRDYVYTDNKCGLRIINYDDMLYPQYSFKFQKTITSEIFNALQRQAKKNLKEYESAAERVVLHWQKIANGEAPFGYRILDD